MRLGYLRIITESVPADGGMVTPPFSFTNCGPTLVVEEDMGKVSCRSGVPVNLLFAGDPRN